MHIPLGTHANKQERIAGLNIGGVHATFPGVIGTAVNKVCGLEVARTACWNVTFSGPKNSYVTTSVESTNRAPYFPGAAPMTVKIVAERPTGRLLGGQIIGQSEAAKHIDPLAVAIWNNMTVADMTGLDLGYAPPYAPVWDPVLIAARKAANILEREARGSSPGASYPAAEAPDAGWQRGHQYGVAAGERGPTDLGRAH